MNTEIAQRRAIVLQTVVVGPGPNLTWVVLVLVGEPAADAFACFVREATARDQIGGFVGFGPRCLSHDVQLFEIPLAPHTNPEMKLQPDSFSYTQRPLHRL